MLLLTHGTVNTAKQTVIPSAISSGDTTDFQTWDLSVWTNAIRILPKFGNVAEWIGIKEVMFFESNHELILSSMYQVPTLESGT